MQEITNNKIIISIKESEFKKAPLKINEEINIYNGDLRIKGIIKQIEPHSMFLDVYVDIINIEKPEIPNRCQIEIMDDCIKQIEKTLFNEEE